MDGILVQDSDWSSKLSSSLASLLQKKQLCDLGIVCGVQNDVSNLKSNEVVMVHRCILAGASETIRKLSIGGQVYNLVKINGIDISTACWDNVLDFVYKSKTKVLGRNLCDVKKAAQVLQIKALETAVDVYHTEFTSCKCVKKNDNLIGSALQPEEMASGCYEISDSNWLTVLFEGMLDLLVKQSLCNMTIITEKQDKVPAEILAHLCMLVASSATIKELVFQGTETYNSVKIDSISYNTWLYLLEYIYTSRVSIVKSNIPEVWIASQLLQIDGLANAVAPFASQMGATVGSRGPFQGLKREDDDQVKSSLIRVKKELLFDDKSPDSPSTSGVKHEKALEDILVNKTSMLDDPETSNDSHLPSISSAGSDKSASAMPLAGTGALNDDGKNSVLGGSLNDAMVAQIPSPLLNVNIGLPGNVLAPVQGVNQQLVLPGTGGLPTLMAGIPGNGQGQLVNAVQSDGTSTMLWLPASQILPIVNSPQMADHNSAASPGSKVGVTTTTSTPQQGLDELVDSSTTGQTQQQHLQQEAESNSLILCSICSQVYTDQNELEKHLYEDHGVTTASPPKQENSSTDINKLKCKFCKKVFSRTWTLNVHLRTHTGERPYRCKTCGKAFSDKSNMRQHSLIHTSKKEYHCPKCDQAFAQKRYMKKHYIETCLRKTAPASLPKTNGQQHYIIAYIGDNQTDSNAPDSSQKEEPSTPELVSPVSTDGVDCDIDLGNEEPLEKALPHGNESSAAWDTSIIITPTQENEVADLGGTGHMEESSDYGEMPLTHEEKLYCNNCKKHFKSTRQRNSHRCMDF